MTRSVYNQLVQQLGEWVIHEHRAEMGDLDGASIQDKLGELGLLERVPVTEPCGERCSCAEYVDEWPAQCLRLVTIEESDQ